MRHKTQRYMVSFFIFLTTTPVSFGAHPFQDLTIVVNSCDKYEELWDPFFKIFFLRWPAVTNGSVPIVLITNTKKFTHPRVNVFMHSSETSWSDTFGRALRAVKTPYILYLQDDYFLSRLNVKRLGQLLEIMKNENAG